MWCNYLRFVRHVNTYSGFSIMKYIFRLSGTFPFNEDEEIEDV
jgi:hypothetical protein